MNVAKKNVSDIKGKEFFDNYIASKDFCKAAHISMKTLQRWKEAGMPYKPMGRDIWVNPWEVSEWHQRRK
jgi:hypothetical protein